MGGQDEVNSHLTVALRRCFVQNISKQPEVSVGLHVGHKVRHRPITWKTNGYLQAIIIHVCLL